MIGTAHLPVLIVLCPLFAAVLTPLIARGRNRAWLLAALASAGVLAMAVAMLVHGRPLSYAVGGWRPPFGIELRVDALNGFVLLIIGIAAAVVTFGSRLSVAREIPDDRAPFFYTIWLLCIAGMVGIAVTGDVFNVYVLLEVASLTMYALVATGRRTDRRALGASFRYLILGTIGASFILLGIGYLYMATGTLNMADMAARLEELYRRWDQGDMLYRKTVFTAFAFLMVGLTLKLGLFPLHAWLPDAYTYAPSSVSALLAATATKVGAYLTIRFLFTVMGRRFSFDLLPTGVVLTASACAAILIGSFLAVRQTDVKRILAYSSVAQIGYIALGFSLATQQGVTASVLHLFNHALIKGGLFLVLGAVAYRLGGTDLRRLQGLGRRMPFTMAAFLAGGLALIGVPLTAGFVSKWYLVSAALEVGHIAIAAVVLFGSILAVLYVWRVVEVIYFQERDVTQPEVREAPWSLVLPAWVLVGASLYFGVHSSLIVRLSEEATRALWRGGA